MLHLRTRRQNFVAIRLHLTSPHTHLLLSSLLRSTPDDFDSHRITYLSSRYNLARSFVTYFCTTSLLFNIICAFLIVQLHNLHANTNSALELASITEFAGHKLAMSSSSSSSASSNRNWLADTGATSHMTPHRHWVHNYTPLRIPIRLADNRVIYSSGVGTVVFNPVIDGKCLQTLEFTKVLHIPELKNSLFSCLYLTKHKGFEIRIDSSHMDFIHNGQTLFCVPIDGNNCAHLSGSIEPLPESANWVSTLPLTPSLWHRRCCHHNFADITKMHKDDLVTGMTFASSEKPDTSVWKSGYKTGKKP